MVLPDIVSAITFWEVLESHAFVINFTVCIEDDEDGLIFTRNIVKSSVEKFSATRLKFICDLYYARSWLL